MRHYNAPKDLLNGKTILVTGSSDGIGKAIAVAYAKHGATVILHGRNIERLENLYDEIVQQKLPKPAILPLDLNTATEQDFDSMAKTIATELGRLDGIVHNAGMISELSPIEFTETRKWHEIMQVNLNAVFMLTRACLPLLKESASVAEPTSIITISSGVGKKGRAFWGPYAVSKFAIEGFTQVLADELEGTNVRINAINPGATRTKMRATAYPAEDASKLTTPDQLIPIYLYLMGKDSVEVNGQSINAQG